MRDFRDKAPTSPAEAATIILDGVRSEKWRILVGEDAQALDRRVRENPEMAYEASFLEGIQAEGFLTEAAAAVSQAPPAEGEMTTDRSLEEDLVGQIGALPTCARCGSKAVVRDAWAVWNPDTGLWELRQVFDLGFCEACEAETEFVWRTVAEVGMQATKSQPGTG